jgi:hypothetical protein
MASSSDAAFEEELEAMCQYHQGAILLQHSRWILNQKTGMCRACKQCSNGSKSERVCTSNCEKSPFSVYVIYLNADSMIHQLFEQEWG